MVGPDSGRYPFLARIEQQLVERDDGQQFRAGIEIILSGVEVLRRTPPSGE
ncbi:hypothetical protein ACIPC2_12090 [Curtobacterium pusillum]|uniref:hypothetical protein n=1 Tax=Curtobacterium pusillum TaxID=69373 RepID=UPI00380D9DFD